MPSLSSFQTPDTHQSVWVLEGHEGWVDGLAQEVWRQADPQVLHGSPDVRVAFGMQSQQWAAQHGVGQLGQVLDTGGPSQADIHLNDRAMPQQQGVWHCGKIIKLHGLCKALRRTESTQRAMHACRMTEASQQDLRMWPLDCTAL